MMDEPAMPIDDRLKVEIIDGALTTLREHYLFPDVALRVAEVVRQRMIDGAYAACRDATSLCDTFTAHLQELSHDKHVRLVYSPAPRSVGSGSMTGLDPQEWEEIQLALRLDNYGFYRVERLPGNVGYLDLRRFAPPTIAGDTVVAAMAFLATCSGLIIDLRESRGGHPGMVALLTTYLVAGSNALDDAVQLGTFRWRGRERQSWTVPFVPGRRLLAVPLFLLTSTRTFSGSEEFAYNLQALKRAVVVGETTGGGGHLTDGFCIHPHFVVMVPNGQPVNAVTGTNWEGVGVTPDIIVPAAEALAYAHREALTVVLRQLGDPAGGPLRRLADEARRALAEHDPAVDAAGSGGGR
jgi:hypothetical protein